MKLLRFLVGLMLTGLAWSKSKKPNVVFILVDDLDHDMGTMSYMPFTQKHILDQGMEYTKHFCTIALCCPSRVSLMTGLAAHNTNVTDVWPPYGGYPKFNQQRLNESYLPLWLQEAGYNTYYAGKLMNYHGVWNFFDPYPANWTSNDFLIDPWTYNYLDSWWVRDKTIPISHKGEYTTDVLHKKAVDYVNEAASKDEPFFLFLAPIAPHANVVANLNFDISEYNQSVAETIARVMANNTNTTKSIPFTYTSSNPIPADRHKNLFNNVVVPRTPNFNPEKSSGVSWISQLPRQNATNVAYNDEFYRDRLRAIQAVDEMVDGVVARLEALGILDNTYIVFSSDNGFHVGQHRLQPGKQCGIETDLHIPLAIRGPGVPKGEKTSIVTTHTDLAPTFFEMLGIKLRGDFDGTPIPFTAQEIEKAVEVRAEHVNVEHWGTSSVEGAYGKDFDGSIDGVPENTYKLVRLYSNTFNLLYSVYCNNQHELYDMDADPWQMNNLFRNGNGTLSSLQNLHIGKFSAKQIATRLDALLIVLKNCKTKDCVEPWGSIHPVGNVKTLVDALNPRYDSFYENAYRNNGVSFTKCEAGYILSSEGSNTPSVYGGGLPWHAFT